MLLLADEPTGALDSHSTATSSRCSPTCNADGRTIVVITHEEEVAAPREAGGADAGRAHRGRPAGRGAADPPPRCVGGGPVNVRESVRFAARGVVSNKLRSVLTMSGILIGVAAVIILIAAGNGASAAIKNSISALGSNTLTVTSNSTAAGRRVGRRGRRRWARGASAGRRGSTAGGAWGCAAGGGASSGGAGAAAAHGRRGGGRRRRQRHADPRPLTLADARRCRTRCRRPTSSRSRRRSTRRR